MVYKNEVFENLKICPITGRVFDLSGKVFSQRIKDNRMLSYIPFPSKKWVFTYRLLGYNYLNLKDEQYIHHKDKNPLNNLLENLECLLPREHTRLHNLDKTEEEKRAFAQSHKGKVPWNKGKKFKQNNVKKFKERS